MNRKHLCLILILFCDLALGATSFGNCRKVVNRLDFSSVSTAEFSLKPADVSTVTHILSTNENSDFAILKLTGNQWRSTWSPDGQNLQSDPRNIIILLGDNIAEKLGFKWIDKKTLRVPKGKYFTSQLIKLNEYLKEINSDPIEISFYDTSSDSPFFALEFLDRALAKRLPVAKAGHFLVHDVAAHYGSILLPREITRELIMKIQIAKKFTQEMEPVLKKLSPQVSSKIRELNDKWLQIVTHRVDTVSGNFTLRYVDVVLSKKTKKEKADFFETEYLKFIRGETTEQLMQKWIGYLFMNIETFRFEVKNFESDFDILYNFTSQFVQLLPQGAREPFDMTVSEFIDKIEKRRSQISLWDGK
jgi:hypothetical protein